MAWWEKNRNVERKPNANIYNEYIAMGFSEDDASRLTIHYLTTFYTNNNELVSLLNSVSSVMDKNTKIKRTFGLSKK